MTGDGIGSNTERLQQVQHSHGTDAQRWLGDIRLLQGVERRAARLIGKKRPGENIATQGSGQRGCQYCVSPVMTLHQFTELQREVSLHIKVLGALTWKEKADIAAVGQRGIRKKYMLQLRQLKGVL